MDIRDLNSIVTKLGVRTKELDGLVSELTFLTKSALGEHAEIELKDLTVMGHGFGATTAI